MGKTSNITLAPVLIDRLWKKDGTNFYRIRVTLRRESKYITTNILVHRDQFYRGKLADLDVRYRLEDIMRRTEAAVASIDPYTVSLMDVNQVVDYITHYNDGEFRLDFIGFGNAVADAKSGTSRSTYRCAIKAFAAFVEKDSFDISRVTSSLMREWEEWLAAKYGRGARAVSAYTACIAYLHGQARLRFNNEETGLTPIKNPFQYYKPPRQRRARHRAVKEDLIQSMIDLREGLSGRERLGVDVFLLSFALMGMNSPDLYDCAAPEGDVLHYYRTKTRDRREDHAEMAVKIPSEIKDILSDYRDDGQYAFNFRKRYTSYEIFGANVNAGLKKFCERVNHEKVTLYYARHSWASIAYRQGVEKGVINDCLCHIDRDMKVTDIYIEKDWSVLWMANEKVLSSFMWGKSPIWTTTEDQ